jgi:predicted 5'-methylthioadenosine/S-adenosylhomocysteine nucleosidase
VLLVVAATERELAALRGVDTFVCGVGPVDAAIATARRLAAGDVATVLHVGIAGARTLEPLTLVLGSESVYCDVIDAGSTFPRLERVSPDAAVLAAARAALPEARVEPIATSGRLGGGKGYDVEAMEGFGVLRAAMLAGVPAIELRAISNAVGEPDRAKWRFDDAFAALGDAVARLAPRLS